MTDDDKIKLLASCPVECPIKDTLDTLVSEIRIINVLLRGDLETYKPGVMERLRNTEADIVAIREEIKQIKRIGWVVAFGILANLIAFVTSKILENGGVI